MVLGISGNAFALSSLEQVNQRLLGNLARLSSGKRIATAADDPAELAISERLRALETTANRGRRNLNDGLSAARVAEGALEQTSADLISMRELAVQAQNSTTSAEDRATIQAEFDQLAAEITRTAESAEFNGRNLLNGDTDASDPLDLEDGTQYSAGLSIEIDSQAAEDLGVEGLDASDPDSLEAIDAAIDSVSSTRADLGSIANRIEHGINNLRAVEEGAASARSRISDLDYAVELAKQARNLIIAKVDLGIMAQANFMQSASLRLLG